MRRIYAGIVVVALALTFVAPLTAQAAAPAAVVNAMFKEQCASQQMIGTLLGTSTSYSTWITTISFGHVTKTSTKAVAPVTVRTRGGSTVVGVLVMRKYGGKWFFYSITRGTSEGGISSVVLPAGISSSAINTSISEQSIHQFLVSGIVSGGYKRLTVLGRTANFNTRTVNIRLSGGTRHSTTGRVTAYRKKSTSGKSYWFLASIK
jgi:small nuclear ribonucleoprotein (snRNP)-like protein